MSAEQLAFVAEVEEIESPHATGRSNAPSQLGIDKIIPKVVIPIRHVEPVPLKLKRPRKITSLEGLAWAEAELEYLKYEDRLGAKPAVDQAELNRCLGEAYDKVQQLRSKLKQQGLLPVGKREQREEFLNQHAGWEKFAGKWRRLPKTLDGVEYEQYSYIALQTAGGVILRWEYAWREAKAA